MTHLDTLRLLLSNERCRLANSKTAQERQLRTVYCSQLEKEIEHEGNFIDEQISDDDLLAELSI